MIHTKNLQFDARGLEKFSLVEWPGKICAIIFTAGCNFRCPFCHNPELVTGLANTPAYPWEEIEKFLDKKIGWIDAVEITGGEPTLQPDLPKVCKILKNKGFMVSVATNGTNPEMLEKLIPEKLVDRVQMDIKNSLDKYGIATGDAIDKEPLNEAIKKSVEILKNSPIEYGFRTTIVPDLIKIEDMEGLGELIKGAKKISLQQFRPLRTLDKSYQSKVPYCKEEIIAMGKKLEKYVEEVNLEFID